MDKTDKGKLMTEEEALNELESGEAYEYSHDTPVCPLMNMTALIRKIYEDLEPDCSTCKHTSVSEHKEPCASCIGLTLTTNNWEKN